MDDSYGDGLVGEAFYQVWLDGEMLVEGSGNYGFGQSHAIDCPPGWTCNEAIELVLGDDPLAIEAAENIEWWTFTPADKTACMRLSSCGSGLRHAAVDLRLLQHEQLRRHQRGVDLL